METEGSTQVVLRGGSARVRHEALVGAATQRVSPGAHSETTSREGVHQRITPMHGQQEQSRAAQWSARSHRADGFTVIELMLALAIVGILFSVATVSYDYFLTKAKSVEGGIVVHEVDRLEYLYHASNNQAYTDSFADLGFAMTTTLKSYTPEVRIGNATD